MSLLNTTEKVSELTLTVISLANNGYSLTLGLEVVNSKKHELVNITDPSTIVKIQNEIKQLNIDNAITLAKIYDDLNKAGRLIAGGIYAVSLTNNIAIARSHF